MIQCDENDISDITRRIVLDYLLEARGEPFYGRLDIPEFLGRIWKLSEFPSEDKRHANADGDIWEHTVNNPGDYTDRYLLTTRLRLEDCDDAVFLKFVEECLNPHIVANLNNLDKTATALNSIIVREGYQLFVEERVSGWPVYRSRRTGKEFKVASINAESFPYSATDLAHAMIALLMNRGQAREVTLLTLSDTHSLHESRYDNWNGGTYFWTLSLRVPTALYARLGRDEIDIAEKLICEVAEELIRDYNQHHVESVIISASIATPANIREQALSWLNGEGVNNQGRVRSDNIASREHDGLLFRSQSEIRLYRALKAEGLVFAPLPVYLRGGEQYHRLEPDFVIFKDGVVLVVEVDGDSVHQESPAVAGQRLRIFTDEGALTHRILASQCETDEQARECVIDIVAMIEKHVRRR